MDVNTNPYELCIGRADHARQIASGLENDADKLETEAADKRGDALKWRAKSAEFINAAEVVKDHIEKILVTKEVK